jgi:hypothetical protein
MPYLMEIYPTQFTAVGNLNVLNDENEMISFIWSNDSYLHLFGIRTAGLEA